MKIKDFIIDLIVYSILFIIADIGIEYYGFKVAVIAFNVTNYLLLFKIYIELKNIECERKNIDEL